MNTIDREHIIKAFEFEKLVGDILENSGYKILSLIDTNEIYDYKCDYDGKTFIFEVKYYRDNVGNMNKMMHVCKKLASLNQSKVIEMVIICANHIEEDLKHRCKNEYNITVVDIKNIIFMIRNNEYLINKLKLLLEYSIVDIIEAKPSIPFSISESKIQKEDIDINEIIRKLEEIKTGREHFANYEIVCCDILEYLFNDYLALWNKQVHSNDELYRFDLCCRIKTGDVEEFFEIIRGYFKSKYIIFEFKNYEDKISQKEIYTTEKYLYAKALRGVAIIITRKGINTNGIKAIKGCLRENGKLIIVLTDNDLKEMLYIKYRNESPSDYMMNILDYLLLTLEK